MKKLHWLVRFLFGPVPVYFSALAILIVLTNAQYFGLVGVGVAPRTAKLASSAPVVSVMKYCDIFRGEWVPDAEAPYYNHKTCHMIQEHQNCLKYGRPDLGFLKWRWRPSGCELPRFDPLQAHAAAAGEPDRHGGPRPALLHRADGGVPRRGEGRRREGAAPDAHGRHGGDADAARRPPQPLRALAQREGAALQRLHPLVPPGTHRHLERHALPDAPRLAASSKD
ncbi:TRICHOME BIREFRINGENCE-LIKE 20 [Zea mays]|uniref:TRICHOME BIREFRINGENCE-LIKE 20 n=1 Tax=Zea mays TaxID=4577 RepID=A0A1D6NHE8_MAIZE|nr:TRICHOME BIREFRINGENCE-LIKE 20 [Zea mays]